MNDRHTPILRSLSIAAGVTALLFFTARGASADVVGRLHFSVKNAADEKPIAGAKIVLHDSAGARADVTLTSDAKGNATTDPLDTRPWQIKTSVGKSDEFQPDTRTVNVVADTTTEVEILLEPVKEKVVVLHANKEVLNQNQTNISSVRDQNFIKSFPVSVGNPQSLNDILKTNPSFAADSNNQVHPRGEHSATAYNIDGFYLPGALQGRAESLLTPDTVQSIDALTGGYSPEYGGETAAILNISLRSGPIKPFLSYSLAMGEFATYFGSLTAGGQLGPKLGSPDAEGRQAHRFGYLIDVTGRTTNNAIEPPQPNNQAVHNSGESSSFFGNFTYQAGPHDDIKLTLNSTPALTQVAPRTGLPSSFASVGQGFGYVGLRNADGTEPLATPGTLGSQTMILPSQAADGQDIFTRDGNDFGVLNFRHTFNSKLTALASFGDVHSFQSVLNNSPFINQSALPIDSSIEYNPTVIRNEHQDQVQASLTYSGSRHTFKGGILSDEQIGNEFYQLIPASQLALDSEAANAPNLVAAGHVQTNSKGAPVLDAAGNPVYVSNPGATAPALSVHKTGFYRAAYVQDTWGVTNRLTLNYGLRLDWYKSDQSILGAPAANGFVDQSNVSPRFNSSYKIDKSTVFRASFNRLFIQPPQSQGSVVGQAIVPETLNQYDASIERQVGRGQSLKFAYYNKDMRNQIDTNLLIPFTQIGVYTSVNFQNGSAKGTELSYNLTPREYFGTRAYVSWANSVDKPGGLQNTGAPVPNYNDHDALNIISTGIAYTWRNGYNAAGTYYYSSGTASSIIMPTDALSDGIRQAHDQVNISVSTGPGLFGGGPVNGHGGLTLAIENLFNHTSVINFDSGFSGTRFQQARRVMFTAFGKF